MSSEYSVYQESEDIRSMSRETAGMNINDESVPSGEESVGADRNELKAAAALTRLNMTAPPQEVEEKDENEDEEEDEFVIPQRFTKSGRKRAVPFPLKLMKVLSSKEYADIIAWTPSGKAFTILKPKLFVTHILPDHFKNAKYSSFTRKLHRWGFMRHYRGEEAGAFYHNDFLRDRPELVEKMTCYKQQAESAKPMKKKEVVTVQPVTRVAPVQPAPRRHSFAESHSHQPATLPQLASMARSLPPMQIATQAQLVPQIHRENTSADLNAAIEMEVNRRLQERIKAAAASRRAMLLMEEVKLRAASRGPLTQPYVAWNQALNIRQALAFKQLQSVALPEGPNRLSSLPQTNIQGAKTA